MPTFLLRLPGAAALLATAAAVVACASAPPPEKRPSPNEMVACPRATAAPIASDELAGGGCYLGLGDTSCNTSDSRVCVCWVAPHCGGVTPPPGPKSGVWVCPPAERDPSQAGCPDLLPEHGASCSTPNARCAYTAGGKLENPHLPACKWSLTQAVCGDGAWNVQEYRGPLPQ